MRWGCAVGKDGFRWAGLADVGRKVMWPRWTPPKEMIARHPEKAKWANGMPGGPDNPLGARALYLFQNGQDTLYRIHGTTDPMSIGHNASSGCIRMVNQDVDRALSAAFPSAPASWCWRKEFKVMRFARSVSGLMLAVAAFGLAACASKSYVGPGTGSPRDGGTDHHRASCARTPSGRRNDVRCGHHQGAGGAQVHLCCTEQQGHRDLLR